MRLRALFIFLALCVAALLAIRAPAEQPLLIDRSSIAATPASASVPAAIPVDATARAKFPRDLDRKGGGERVDALAFVNRFVNARMQSVSDREHYGTGDLWVMAPSDGKGDCEDYALTKLFILRNAGFPIASNAKLVTVIVHAKAEPAEGHAILALRLPSGEVAYLDNNFPGLMTRAELVAAGYEFFDWRA